MLHTLATQTEVDHVKNPTCPVNQNVTNSTIHRDAQVITTQNTHIFATFILLLENSLTYSSRGESLKLMNMTCHIKQHTSNKSTQVIYHMNQTLNVVFTDVYFVSRWSIGGSKKDS